MIAVERKPEYERGTYYFFDAQNWRKVAKEFHLDYGKLEDKPSIPMSLHSGQVSNTIQQPSGQTQNATAVPPGL